MTRRSKEKRERAAPASSPQGRLLRDIYVEAAEIEDPGKRAAYLNEACLGNSALRERVESLLSLEQAEAPPPASVRRDEGSGELDPGSWIGSYKLLEQIGEGGFGIVYMAEQEKPVCRRVALKVIKPGMDSKQVVARFDAERQALAMMDHPSIAQVFEAGSTNAGRPYFVMELVRGIPLTEYCTLERLEIKRRLELFVQVCHAVQHAHQKGIIHRDLKPSNVLVTEIDGRPQPKIIDFGIAKAMQGRLTDATLFTSFEQLVGTPSYMSPEQASMVAGDIDTRSDIYSLGVLLYEVLTGSTPFDTKALLKAGLDQMRQTIREVDPERPSTRLMRAPSTTHPHLPVKSRFDEDLDWIVMKCLEKERRRRYETADSLAMDVQRHLEHRPIIARAPTRRYQLQKSFRRNKVVFTAGTMIAAALLLGLGVATWQFLEKSQALGQVTEAEAEQSRLRQAAEDANFRANRDLRQSLLDQVRLATLTDALSRRDLAVSALTRAAEIQATPDMVEIAVTALSMFQVRDLGVVIPSIEGQILISVNPQINRYVWHGGEQSRMDVQAFPTHKVIQSFTWESPAFWDQIDWLPAGDRMLARRRNGPIELWHVSSGAMVWSRAVTEAESENQFAGKIGVDPSGTWSAHINPDSKVEIIETSDGKRIALLETQTPPSSLSFHPREPWIAIGTEDGVEIFDWRKNRRMFQRKSGRACTGLTWSPDGQAIAHTGWAYLLELWDPGGDQKMEVPLLGGYFAPPRFSANGRWLAVCNEQGVLTLRSGQSGVANWEKLNGYPIAFDAKGSRLYRQVGESGVSAYELSDSECYAELEVPFYADSSLPGLAISPDERWVAATSYWSGIHLWDLENPGPPVRRSMFGVSSAMFNQSGTQLLTCVEQGVQIWDFIESENGPELKGPRLLEGATGSSRRLTHTHGSERFVVVSTKAGVWKFPRNHYDAPVRLPSRDQQSAAISPDGRWLVESSFYSPVAAHDLEENQWRPDLAPHGGLVAFSPDGRWLTVGRGGAVEAWDTANWTRAWKISTQTTNPSAGHCVFRPQGDLLATLDKAEEIVLVRPSDGQRLLRLVSPRPGPINRMCFSDSGKILLASTEEGRIQIWRLDELERQLLEIGLDWIGLLGMPRIRESS